MAQLSGDQTTRLARCAVVFEAAEPPRAGQMAFWDPDGVGLPMDAGKPGQLTVVQDTAGTVRTVPAVRLPVSEAMPVLSRARRSRPAHQATAFWGTATVVALQLVARGRMEPSESTKDSWRAGPLEPADLKRIGELAAELPEAGPNAAELVRGFLDAVADGVPRTAAAVQPASDPTLFSLVSHRNSEWRKVSTLRSSTAGIDSRLRMSLRLEVATQTLERASVRAVVQLHRLADATVVADASDVWNGAVEHLFGPRAQIEAETAVRRAARAWAPLEMLLLLPVPDELELAPHEVAELLGRGVERLTAAGVEVHWPRELVRELTASAVVSQTEAPPSDMPTFFGGGERALSLNWQLALRGDPLTEAELEQLASSHQSVVRLRDQWVVVDPELARRARECVVTPLTPIDALGLALTGATEVDGKQIEVAPNDWLEALRRRIAEPDSGREPVRQPAALNATLRDYQLRGLRWLERMTSLGLGGCLADDMGLGKTITLIALHLHRQDVVPGPTLVVCPASLLGNWEREIQRFAPGTEVRRFHGTGRSLDGAVDGFVLTTYGTMRRDVGVLGAHRWGLIVADEAQHVKNPLSSTAKALRRLGGASGPASARVALTGTPVENNLSELWSILDWTTPGLLGTLGAFRTRWAKRIESGAADGPAVAERLARLVRPFLLRRRKSDPGIAPELPPKTETDQPVALTREQAGLYQAVVRETMAKIRASSGMERRGLIVKLLTGLKQICNHPAQYLKESAPKLAGRSGKLELLDELVDTIVAEDGAVLVFTQYVAMARLLERHLGERGVPTQLLHGGTPVARREEMVDRFQSSAGEVPVFLLSLKAAGTGLNLTRADHVVHYDRWWNPAVEEQATDRAYRIGQTRPVQVHRLIAEGTVEDRIAAMLRSKRALADAVLGSGEVALSELSDAELAELVQLTR